jgi:hypothetical protein
MKALKRFTVPNHQFKNKIHRTIIISKDSELYPYCYKHGKALKPEEVREKLLDAPEEIIELAIRKKMFTPFLRELAKKHKSKTRQSDDK